MNLQMLPTQVDALLSELCVTMGFCLPPDEAARLRKSPPTDVDAFTDAVIRAEGLDPYADIPRRMRRDVRSRVADHFQKAEEDQEE
jgi:hypothetical protein